MICSELPGLIINNYLTRLSKISSFDIGEQIDYFGFDK